MATAPVTLTRRRVRHVVPSTIARWLEVKDDTVRAWIVSKQLPAVNIGTRPGHPRYVVFIPDLAEFLEARGMTQRRVRSLLG